MTDKQACRDTGQQKLRAIVDILHKPNGFSQLSPEQRKFAFAVLLAMIVPADRSVRIVELERLKELLGHHIRVSSTSSAEAMALAEMPPVLEEAAPKLAQALGELLGAEDRSNFIGHLWEIALADDELHAFEEKLIFSIADKAGVPRKNVAAQLARAASH